VLLCDFAGNRKVEGSSLQHMKDNAWLGGAIAVQNRGDRMVVSESSTWLACTDLTVIVVGFKLKAVRAERQSEREISGLLSGF
jgi:hypothetical protein